MVRAISNRGAITERPMVGVLSMAAAAETSTVTVPPIATGNKHRPGQSHRPASGDGSGTGITGFAPASEYKTARFDLSPGPLAASGEGQKPESASGQTRG